MNPYDFRRAVEARILRERDERLSDKGVTLAKDTRSGGGHDIRFELADERRQEKEFRLSQIRELRRQGLDAQAISMKTGLSRSQIYWLEKQRREAVAP